MSDQPDTFFQRFRSSLEGGDVVKRLQDGLIGHDTVLEGPFGAKKMVYADYVASGRAVRQIEEAVLSDLLPYYANSHTEASFVGGTMTRLRREARNIIRSCCNATQDHAVIFTGSGATQGINRLVHLLGIPEDLKNGNNPVVLIGPYEHHSNILPWRESGAEVIEIAQDPCGGPDGTHLDEVLARSAGRPIVASFSAASNVTGILTDVAGISRKLKATGARVVWDYAGGAPYLPIDMRPEGEELIDAVVLSPHKFVGGPQATGVLIVRNNAVRCATPTFAGGGTVRFVSPTCHDYTANVEAREEAGTPNVIGDLRAAMCFVLKDCVGQAYITERNARNTAKALRMWGEEPLLEILGNTGCPRLPILSFRVRDGQGGYVHQQLFTRMLSDHYGIQARGGCACAGPYVHRLLGIEHDESEALRAAILSGKELEKPGFVRLNLSYLASDEEVDFILSSVRQLAQTAAQSTNRYTCDPSVAIFSPVPA